MKFGLLAPVADHAGNAGLARDTGSIGVYIALLGVGRLRLEAVQLEIAHQAVLPQQYLM